MRMLLFDRDPSPKKEVINCYLFLFLQCQFENMMLSLHTILLIQLNPDRTVRPKRQNSGLVKISDKNTS